MKQKSIYTCQQCGYQSPKWLGKCPDCSQWDSLTEEQVGRVFKDIDTKRSTTAYLHLSPQLVVEVPEIRH